VEGAVPAVLRLYRASTGGVPFHEETGVTLDVDNGVFTHHLGTTIPLDLTDLDGTRVWLGVQIGAAAELVPRVELATTPHAAYARHAATAGSVSSVAWGSVTGVPASLADGDQDTTYTAQAPLALSGTVVGLSSAGCVPGETWVWTAGGWSCEPAGTSLSAGAGLALTGSVLSVDTSAIQARVASGCTAGQAIRAISSTGVPTCEVIPAATAYLAGTGLTLTGTTFAVDATYVQRPLTGSCAPGSSIRSISAAGVVECETDDGQLYAAGTGLTLTGGTFAVTYSEVQRRLQSGCSAGQAIRSVGSDGVVTCEPMPVDTNTTYTAGTGLTLAGTVFSANPAAVQTRIQNSCSAGQYVVAIAQDGTMTCATPADQNTTYGAGTGLVLSGTTFSANTTYLQRRVSGTCTGNQYVQSISDTGAVSCATPTDQNTTYAAGTGLSLTGTTFSVDPASVQTRIANSCGAGQYVTAIAQNGTMTCATPTDQNTTYSAGSGLTLTGTQFTINEGYTQRRVTGTCTGGNSFVQTITSTGTVTCGSFTEVGLGDITGVTAGTGLSGGGTTGTPTLSINETYTQRRVGACPAGQAIQSVAANGTPTCVAAGRDVVGEMLLRAQGMMTGGGYILFNGNGRLSWTQRIINIGSLPNSANSTMHQNIEMPPVGYTIPGWNGSASQQVQSDGIPIPDWTGLYYEMRRGDGTQASDPSRFRMVYYPTLSGSATLPAEWVLVAFKNGDSLGGQLYVNTEGGITLDTNEAYDSRFGELHTQMTVNTNGTYALQQYTHAPYHQVTSTHFSSAPIPHNVILEYCGDIEGCEITLGIRQWTSSIYTAMASRTFRFYYSQVPYGTGRWYRRDYYANDFNAVDGDGTESHIVRVWHCHFSDHAYVSSAAQNDGDLSLHLLSWNNDGHNFSGRTCEITIYD
jgi:hypothetical protein